MNNQIEKAKRTIKKYRYEITLVGIGVVVGHKIAKRRCYRAQDALVHEINDRIEKAFAEVEGNFSIKGGGYIVPLVEV